MAIWERMEGESDKAYRAFNLYLLQGLGKRSLTNLNTELGKSRGYIKHLEGWSSKFSWGARCQAWDAREVSNMLKIHEESRKRMYADATTQARSFRNLAWGHLIKRLSPPTAKIKDGEDAKSFTNNQLITLFDLALKAELLTQEGVLTNISESAGKFEVDVQTKVSIYDLVKNDPEAKHHITRALDALAGRRTSADGKAEHAGLRESGVVHDADE